MIWTKTSAEIYRDFADDMAPGDPILHKPIKRQIRKYLSETEAAVIRHEDLLAGPVVTGPEGPPGSAESNGRFALTGRVSAASLAADTTDWNPATGGTGSWPASSFVDFGVAKAGLTINSIVAGSNGQIIYLRNTGVLPAYLAHNGAGSAGNKIVTLTGRPLLVPASSNAVLRYDSSLDAWVVISALPAETYFVPDVVSGDGSVRVVGQAGFRLAEMNVDGSIRTGLVDLKGRLSVSSTGELVTDGYIIRPGPGLRDLDRAGFLGPVATGGGDGVVPIATGFSASEIVSYDGRALALTASRTRPILSVYQRPTARYNVILVYGQSLGGGSEGWPRLTKTALMSGVYMIGDSVRPNSPTSAGWTPVGTPALNPAVACVQNSSGAVLSDGDVAALAPGAYGLGEETGIAAAYTLRKLWLEHHGIDADPAHEIIVVNCSVGGRSVAELSPDPANPGQSLAGGPEYFNRVREAFALIQSLAGAEEVRLIATMWKQGEEDYANGTSIATYTSGVINLRNKIQDEANAAFGQSKPALWLSYQTAGALAKNTLTIGDAQRALARSQPLYGLSAPTHPYPDKGGHLDPNGYRWLGCMDGLALYQWLILGRQTTFMEPIDCVYRGSTVLMTYDVPVPPIRIAPIWDGNALTTYDQAGLYLVDSAGALPVSAVEVAGQATLKLTLSRAVSGPLTVYAGRYAGSYGGNNICDSDSTLAPFNYKYASGTGQYAEADQPDYNDKPYPLTNYSVNFKLLATGA